ncbi:MAG: PilN domain-containing protein [Candidatus Nealsonbacteria bacterium]|nr:PilN domain-containing protein [Candidatus Nealsonbacteria bacterium]
MINLLPHSEKNILRIIEKEKIILILEIILLFFFVCLILFLFLIKIQVAGQVEAEKIILEQEKKEFESLGTKNISEDIISINKKISDLKSFYEKQFSMIEILEKISKTLSDEVYLNNFSYTNNNSQVVLSGFSKTQEGLLKFKQNLEQEKDFQGIFFPLSSWIAKKDISFNLNFKLKNENGI